MFKTVFVTKLNPEDKKKFTKFHDTDSKSKREAFIEALKHFRKKYSTKKKYQLKHNEIDRLRSEIFQIQLLDDQTNEVNNLAKDLGINKVQLLREIICEHLDLRKE